MDGQVKGPMQSLVGKGEAIFLWHFVETVTPKNQMDVQTHGRTVIPPPKRSLGEKKSISILPWHFVLTWRQGSKLIRTNSLWVEIQWNQRIHDQKPFSHKHSSELARKWMCTVKRTVRNKQLNEWCEWESEWPSTLRVDFIAIMTQCAQLFGNSQAVLPEPLFEQMRHVPRNHSTGKIFGWSKKNSLPSTMLQLQKVRRETGEDTDDAGGCKKFYTPKAKGMTWEDRDDAGEGGGGGRGWLCENSPFHPQCFNCKRWELRREKIRPSANAEGWGL